LDFSPFNALMLCLELAVKLESHLCNMPLCCGEQVSRASNFRSRMAILKPLPRLEYCLIALMRFRASVSKPHDVATKERRRLRL
jgi:hypothetical protein